MDDILKNKLLSSSSGSQWANFGMHDHHGFVIPLFAVYTNTSAGIGDFFDIVPIMEWCKKLSVNCIQLLPLNDTNGNSSPYGIYSSRALNIMHINLVEFAYKYPDLKVFYEKLKNHCSNPSINYEKIFADKELFLRKVANREIASLSVDVVWENFCDQPWVQDYACYKFLKKKFDGQSWEHWGQQYLEENEKQQILKEEESIFHMFTQFVANKQFSTVRNIADDIGIKLIGDIPIFINRDSVDVWSKRENFLLELSVGAPSDMYNIKGQNWGFPAYNWQFMEHDGYSWWKDRLQAASRYYHGFRIDHAVGLFRTWAQDANNKSCGGKFYPESANEWMAQGKKILDMMLKTTQMLPIAEDLGTVPPEVKDIIKISGICGMKVMRWERFWDGDKSFINSSDYDPISMTTVSTHDSELLDEWWESFPEESREFAVSMGLNYEELLSKEYRKKILRLSHQSSSIFHINLFTEYLFLREGFFWEESFMNRVNIPGTISDNNWSFRYKVSVDDIIADKEFFDIMNDILK